MGEVLCVGSFLLLTIEKSLYVYNVGRSPETNVFLVPPEGLSVYEFDLEEMSFAHRVELEIVKPSLCKLHHTFLSAGSIGKVKKLASDKTYFPFSKNLYE